MHVRVVQWLAATTLLLAAKAMLVQPLQAPELLEGHPATIQSDIYAFGLIMSELLIWQLPFAEEQQAGFSPFRVRCRAAGEPGWWSAAAGWRVHLAGLPLC